MSSRGPVAFAWLVGVRVMTAEGVEGDEENQACGSPR